MAKGYAKGKGGGRGGGAAGPDGTTANWTPDKGGVLFHGTSSAFSKFTGHETYLTDDYDEATAYAQGVHLGGAHGRTKSVVYVQAKPGRTRNINAGLERAMAAGDDPDDYIQSAATRAKSSVIRYLTYNHPSNVGQGTQRVIVSLHPKSDLKITKRYRT